MLLKQIVLVPHTVTATYEAVQKRTFLPMAIMIATHLPLLLILIILYPTMGKREHEIAKANLLGSKKYASGSDEEQHLVSPKHSKDYD